MRQQHLEHSRQRLKGAQPDTAGMVHGRKEPTAARMSAVDGGKRPADAVGTGREDFERVLARQTIQPIQPIMEVVRTGLEVLPLNTGLSIEEYCHLKGRRTKPGNERIYLKRKDYLSSLGLDFS